MILFTGLQAFWFCYISVVFLVFFLLDGFDMGIGMMLPFISKERKDRKMLLDIVWPFWDGNELWAIIAVSMVFTVFSKAFAVLFGAFSPVIAVLLLFLILRTISFEAWYRDAKGERFWEYIQAVGSLVLAFAVGFVYGNLIAGLPMTGEGALSRMPWAAFQPFAFLSGVLSAAAALSHGAFYLRKKTTGGLRDKTIAIVSRMMPVTAVLGLIVFILILVIVPEAAHRPLFWAGGTLSLACGAAAFILRNSAKDHSPFNWSALSIAGYWAAAGSALFPYVLRPKQGSAGMALNGVSNGNSTMVFLAVFSLIALVITGGYTVFVYRVFKGKPETE